MWVVIHSPALCRLMWLPECAAIRRLPLPSLFVLVLCRRLCSNFPLLHTHVHTHSPLVVLECVLVGQRLHNTELWVPSHVLVHHDYTHKPPLLPKWPKKPGTELVKKSSSQVPCNEIHLIHRWQIQQQQCVQLLQHASVYSTASLKEGGYETGNVA